MAQPGRLEISVRQHTEIVRLVVEGNASKASRAMSQHMTDAARSARNVVR